MKKLLLLALILMITVSTIGCAAPNTASAASTASAAATGTYQTIKPEDVKKKMDNGDAITIVDVRTAGEYNNAHLKGAINIPVETILDKKPAELNDLNAVIIVYCQTGARSAMAAKELVAQGYTAVYDMGGIIDWPYDTESTTDASQWPSVSGGSSSGGVLSAFKANDINSNPVDATIFSGYKLTMVNVWATFCSPCLAEMPDLGKLNSQYTDKGFQVVGIIADAADGDGVVIKDMVDTAKEIIDKTGAGYLHLLPSADLNKLLLYQVAAVPTTIFVDAKGNKVGETYVGSRSGDEWASIIEGLLKEVG